MAKYMILYNSPMGAAERMAKSTPEEMKTSMEEWMRWQEEANKTAKMEWGMPLQIKGNVSSEGVTDSKCPATGYATMEADNKDMVLELIKTHPHLKGEGTSIDVLEMLPMPGM